MLIAASQSANLKAEALIAKLRAGMAFCEAETASTRELIASSLFSDEVQTLCYRHNLGYGSLVLLQFFGTTAALSYYRSSLVLLQFSSTTASL
jgi:hypothetical protein